MTIKKRISTDLITIPLRALIIGNGLMFLTLTFGIITDAMAGNTISTINNGITSSLVVLSTVLSYFHILRTNDALGITLLAGLYTFLAELPPVLSDPVELSLKLHMSAAMAIAFLVIGGFVVNRVASVVVGTTVFVYLAAIGAMFGLPYVHSNLIVLGVLMGLLLSGIWFYKIKIESMIRLLKKSQAALKHELDQS
jgi:hypothetical protein